MTKIIKYESRKKIECPDCGCYFSYEEGDIEKSNNSNDYGFCYDKKYLRCPQCSNKIILEQTK